MIPSKTKLARTKEGGMQQVLFICISKYSFKEPTCCIIKYCANFMQKCFEASRGAGAQIATVKSAGYGFDPHSTR